ncbi:APC family permease [Demequina oxidasica]|uniref:APC family permease n=1 Tax=Demequina oxidasica TaxID=676199 RepID=UPI0007849FFA|nr:APC family permease [Demequina oxidasica]
MAKIDGGAEGKSADRTEAGYRENSLTLRGAIAMGTGVMVGAGIFALTGQVAELAGPLFPLAFLAAAGVAGLSAYAYVKVTRVNPSAGGIAMILTQAYGRRTIAAGSAMLMALSMVLNEALVARTFGTYILRPFGGGPPWLISVLAVALVAAAVGINLARNESISWVQTVGAVIKIGGIGLLAIAAIAVSGFSYKAADEGLAQGTSIGGFVAATALAVLAYKGFTTITNDGAELKEPRRNVGRAIIISLSICAALYVMVSFSVGASLSVSEIVDAKDYSLAQAAQPALGQFGINATVVVAVVATVTGLIASLFAVSRMLTMVTDMKMIPHRHFGLPGTMRQHVLVYVGVVAAVLAATLGLSAIAAVGIIVYLIMDIALQWGVLRHLRKEVKAKAWVIIAALAADVTALVAFVLIRGAEAPWVIVGAAVAMVVVFGFEAWYLRRHPENDEVGQK